MARDGLDEAQATRQIWIVDLPGLLTDDMSDGLLDYQRPYARPAAETAGWRQGQPNPGGGDIPAGTAVRFEPGDERRVTLVPFGGKRRVHGFNNLVDGWAPPDGAYRPRAARAMRLAAEYGFTKAEAER